MNNHRILQAAARAPQDVQLCALDVYLQKIRIGDFLEILHAFCRDGHAPNNVKHVSEVLETLQQLAIGFIQRRVHREIADV